MNKKTQFVLAWGRTLFFGTGLILILLTSLLQLRSSVIFKGSYEWFFYGVVLIGQSGILMSLVYFFLYAPVVLFFPRYYLSRLWAISLILILNSIIYFDGYLWTTYQLRLNHVLLKFIQQDFLFSQIQFNPLDCFLYFLVLVILFLFYWYYSEKVWRTMQARFSNPVKNWYLILFFVFFIIGQVLYLKSESDFRIKIDQLINLVIFYKAS